MGQVESGVCHLGSEGSGVCLVSFLYEKTMVIVCVLLQPGDLGSRQALSASVLNSKWKLISLRADR